MNKKTSPKKINLTDTLFVIGFIGWSCYFVGRCRVEGYLQGLGIPLEVVSITKESYIEIGGMLLFLWAFLAPGLYFMVKGILSALSQLRSEKLAKLATFFSRCSEDTRLMAMSVLAFGLGSALLYFGSNFFLQQGKKRAEQYLLNPTLIRYTEKSAPSKKQEAILLHRNSGRYFLKPKTISKDVSFIIVQEGEFSTIEILK